MDKVYHWLEEGFIQAGTFFISDKYTQGVDVEFIVDRKDWYIPGVYIFANKQGSVLKIGESGKLADRMFNQYKCIDNVTNNRIRESLKADYKKVNFFFFPVPQATETIMNREITGAFHKQLEEQLLKEYFKNTGKLPTWNEMRK
tara:strand:+ start:119 stop:550 length:432 start_codon:yes stop_codon:yes gene_type:complete